MTVSPAIAAEYTARLKEHLHWVRVAGAQLGVPPTQLLLHDKSKWSEPEFSAYANHLSGEDNQEEYRQALAHHFAKNAHHWEHWLLDNGTPVPMPENYALEMIADWLGAGRTYTGKWDMSQWLAENTDRITLHPITRDFVCRELSNLGYETIVAAHPFPKKKAPAERQAVLKAENSAGR